EEDSKRPNCGALHSLLPTLSEIGRIGHIGPIGPIRTLMSYRAFKRLLGETDLERKCRFLLGAGILVLMVLSFWGSARQTDSLADDQMRTSGWLRPPHILSQQHSAGE